MSALHEAAQRLIDLQDMDRVEIIMQFGHKDDWLIACRCARDALRAVLAEPAQEPVAWMVYTEDGKSVCVTDNPADFADEHRALPLYTAPPQRPPLTDEEIESMWEADTTSAEDCQSLYYFKVVARAVERKVRGEKE
jgi:hypothetical protein